MYDCSAFSPSTFRMSCGFDGPSINGSPARTRSPSCTLTCTPRRSAYSRGSPPRPARPHPLAFLHVDVHAARQRVFPRLRARLVRDDDDLPLTLDDAAVLDDAVDFRDER